MKIVLVAGARPNFMKIAPVVAELRCHPGEFTPLLVHTGQHYDELMSDVFFSDLEMPAPDHHLAARPDGAANRLADIIAKFDTVLDIEKPDLVVVVGDVISTLACAMATAVRDIPLAHIEAGLRSGDRRLPEELHRIATDSMSDILYTYSRDADANLAAENVPERCVRRVGNLMIDTLRKLQPKAAKSSILEDLGLAPKAFGVVTLHRQSNVDNAGTLRDIMRALDAVQDRIPLVFPVHPRTRANIDRFDLRDEVAAMANLCFIDPVGYIDMLHLLQSAALALVDSGGIQEETTVLGVPCLTLRESTERPETITVGTNTLVGTAPERIVAAANRALDDNGSAGSIPELWDGGSAQRLVADLRTGLERR